MELSMRFLLSILIFTTLSLAVPEPQTYTYAPFSGAIYLIAPNGQTVNTASADMCPSYASVSCSSIGQPSWCCPNSYTCASVPSSPGLIGCCPAGSTCGGSVNAAAITTITVQTLVTSTLAPVYVAQTSVVYVQATTTVQPVYVAQTTAVVVQGGNYCATLTENGPGLPTTRPGYCGTILIVSGAERAIRVVGVGVGIVVVLLHVALGRMFRFGAFW